LPLDPHQEFRVATTLAHVQSLVRFLLREGAYERYGEEEQREVFHHWNQVVSRYFDGEPEMRDWRNLARHVLRECLKALEEKDGRSAPEDKK